MKGNKKWKTNKELAPVVQRVDNAIHRINLYLLDGIDCFANTYLPHSDLSTSEQLGPGFKNQYTNVIIE